MSLRTLPKLPTLPTLRVDNLSVTYGLGENAQTVLRNVDLAIERGQSYGLVGESGSGKSTLALAVMRQLGGSGAVSEGRIELAGENLLELPEAGMRRVWRERIKFVPQDPVSSLNPSIRVGRQVEEALELPAGSRRDRAEELLARVGLADPGRVAGNYPHQLSGGMQQRVMIAMALAARPQLLILDEPTTNLDVTTEAKILDLVRELIREGDTAVLYVSHSLGVVAQLCDRVAVLYAGELVEDAPVADLFRQPLHPYTRGLLDSLPRLGQDKWGEQLLPIDGQIPQPDELPPGCVFAPRCPVATEFTWENRPPLELAAGSGSPGGSSPGTPSGASTDSTRDSASGSTAGSSRRVRCHRWQEIAAGSIDPRQPVVEDERLPRQGGDRSGEAPNAEEVLRVDGLEKAFPLRRNPWEVVTARPPPTVRAVEGVDLIIRRARTLGLVGESGSGKSTIARCIVGLTQPSDGSVALLGTPLAPTLGGRDDAELRRLQMVFQSADEALNPYMTVGESLRRPLSRLAGGAGRQLDERLAALLEAVKLSVDYASRYPSQLSGGEKQRVAIARAFAAEPDLLLFDESVSGLDVSVQAAILNLLNRLQLERDSAYLFISHDLAVVGYLADDIAVAYQGRLMETGPARAVLESPCHPYTEALLSAVPVAEPGVNGERVRLREETADPLDLERGCPFHTRCPRFLGDICVEQEPPWREHSSGKSIYCHIPLEELERSQAQSVSTSRHEAERGRDSAIRDRDGPGKGGDGANSDRNGPGNGSDGAHDR